MMRVQVEEENIKINTKSTKYNFRPHSFYDILQSFLF
jgi:hypothetical protein